jgi:hypothetical protein
VEPLAFVGKYSIVVSSVAFLEVFVFMGRTYGWIAFVWDGWIRGRLDNTPRLLPGTTTTLHQPAEHELEDVQSKVRYTLSYFPCHV